MNYSMIDSSNRAGLVVESCRVDIIPDETADTSYLEQAEFSDRLAAYNAGEFSFVGVRASAVVSRYCGNGSRQLQEFTSPGIWGVESDSSRDYLRELALEQLGELREHLAAFNVTLPPELQSAAVKGEG